MKKLLGIVVLGLLWCEVSLALPKCEGNNYKNWRNCSGTFTNEDGHKYTGSFDRNGKRFGYSEIKYSDGEYYLGYYENDMKHGMGIYKYTDGTIYSGEFKNNLFDGHGIIESSLKWNLVGEFKEDNLIRGTVKYDDGEIFTGTFCQHINPAQRRFEFSHYQGTWILSDGSVRNGTKDCKTRKFTPN